MPTRRFKRPVGELSFRPHRPRLAQAVRAHRARQLAESSWCSRCLGGSTRVCRKAASWCGARSSSVARPTSPAATSRILTTIRGPCEPAMLLDIFRIFLIDQGKPIASLGLGMEKFVEFGVQRLRVAMGGPLDQQGHEPSRENRDAVPVK